MSGTWREEQVLTTTVASGTAITASGPVDIGAYAHIGMLIPPLTTSTGSLSFDVASATASFYRLNGTDGKTEVKLSVGAGSCAIANVEQLSPYKWVRCVLSATQATERTITFIMKS